MKKKSYADKRKEHLKTYAEKHNMNVVRESDGRGYILDFLPGNNDKEKKNNKRKVVCDSNILKDVCSDMYKKMSMHSRAHHLNSSQVLCYNFFRPLITREGKPTEEFIKLMKILISC